MFCLLIELSNFEVKSLDFVRENSFLWFDKNWGFALVCCRATAEKLEKSGDLQFLQVVFLPISPTHLFKNT